LILNLLAFCGRQGRWVLPAGLIAGFLLPALAAPMRAAIPYLITSLLFIAWLRIADLRSDEANLTARFAFLANRQLMLGILCAQLLLPVFLYFALNYAGVPLVWCMAAVLPAAAAPISGGPNLVLLLGGDAPLALRWLTAGTLMMPLTSIPVLWLLLPGESPLVVLLPVLKLLLIITCAMVAAYFVQKSAGKPDQKQTECLDGLSAILLALMVIGLMSAVHHPSSTPLAIAKVLVIAIAINVGLQILGVVVARIFKRPVIAFGVSNGNRNIALYLAALPMAVTDPLLLFIACYQIPMYLTPLLGRPIYTRLARSAL